MRERQDFEPALRRAASAWEEEAPSAELDDRLRAVVERGRSAGGRGGAPWVGWTAAALVAATAALVVWTRGPEAPSGGPWALQFAPESCAPAALTPVLTLAAGCRVAAPRQALSVEALEAVAIRRTAGALVLERGRARVVVDVLEARPGPLVLVLAGARIEVEAGTIEAVAVAGGGGRVRVESGRARWVGSSGVVALAVGQAQVWAAASPSAAAGAEGGAAAARAPSDSGAAGAEGAEGATPVAEPSSVRGRSTALPARAATRGSGAEASGPAAGSAGSSGASAGSPENGARPAPSAPSPAASAAPSAAPVTPAALDHEPLERTAAIPPSQWSAEQTATAIRWVEQLRAEGRYAEAVTWIARLLEAPLDARAAEVLSFERGQLLESKLRQPDAACAHWQAHRQRFGAGRYSPELAAALARCGATRGNSGGAGR